MEFSRVEGVNRRKSNLMADKLQATSKIKSILLGFYLMFHAFDAAHEEAGVQAVVTAISAPVAVVAVVLHVTQSEPAPRRQHAERVQLLVRLRLLWGDLLRGTNTSKMCTNILQISISKSKCAKQQ